MVSKR